jgi:hypothetical protein
MCLPEGGDAVHSCFALKKDLKSSQDRCREISESMRHYNSYIHCFWFSFKPIDGASSMKKEPSRIRSSLLVPASGEMAPCSSGFDKKGVWYDCRE